MRTSKEVFEIYDADNNNFMGTGFRLNQSRVVLTARHVVKGKNRIRVSWKNPKSGFTTTSPSIYNHPDADLSAIFLDFDIPNSLESFILYNKMRDVSKETKVCTCGYPWFPSADIHSNIKVRFQKGRFKGFFLETRYGYRYLSSEYDFIVKHGQSGSPIFLTNDKKTVIGLVSFCHTPNKENKWIGRKNGYTGGIYLPELSPWINAIVQMGKRSINHKI